MNESIKNIFLFIVFVFAQVFIINKLTFLGNITPHIYILYILTLHVNKKTHMMLIAFAMGITIDILSNTGGVHAFASLITIVFRFKFHDYLLENTYHKNDDFSMKNLSQHNKIFYFTIASFIHSFIFYYVDTLRFDFTNFLIPALISNAITVLIIFPLYYFIKDKK